MELHVSYLAALVAGVGTFLAPCILPLVPAYLSFISGNSLAELTADEKPAGVTRGALLAGLAFVIGLGAVFVPLGASATALGQVMAQNRSTLAIAGGGLIVIFGLHFMGAIRIPFLNYEKRMHIDSKPAGLLGAFLFGAAFAFGWSPCVGPILSMILFQASQGENIRDGVWLLCVYTAGLGIPFLIAAAFASRFMAFLARFRRHMRKIEIGLGLLLVATGILIMTGGLTAVSGWLLRAFPALQSLS